MGVVAVARELGTGAAEIAQAVAHELHAELVDRRIIDEVARRLRITPEEAEQTDESSGSFVEQVLRRIGAGSISFGVDDSWPWSAAYPGDEDLDMHRASLRVTQDVIKEAARTRSAVIVGRGAAYLLKDDPRVVRVFLRAPVEARRAQLMKSFHLDSDTAADRIRQSDANWGAFVRDAYGVEWRDPANYDLVLDTSRVGAERAAGIIVAAAADR